MSDKKIWIVMRHLIEESRTVGIELSVFADFVDKQKINDPNHTPWSPLTPDQQKAKINAFMDRHRFELCELWPKTGKKCHLFAKDFTPRDQLNEAVKELTSDMPGTPVYPVFGEVIERVAFKEAFPDDTGLAGTCFYHLDPALLGVSDPNYCKNYVKTHLSNNKGSLFNFEAPIQAIELSHFEG